MGSPDLFDRPVHAVIVEQFLKGVEFQVNAFIVDGKIEFTSFVRYHKEVLTGVGSLPDYDEWLPYTGPLQQELQAVVTDSANALGIDFDCIHAEIMQDERGVFHVVEIANRPGGSRIPSVEYAATGKSSMRRLARRLLHPEKFQAETQEGYELKKHPRKVAIRYRGPSGRIRSLDLFKQIEGLPHFHKLIPHFGVGDDLHASTSLTDNLALVWMLAPTAEEADEAVRLLRRLEALSPRTTPSLLEPTCREHLIDFGAVAL